MSNILVIKLNGKTEPFDSTKLNASLRSAGASDEEARTITSHIEGELIEGITTSDIYRHAFDLLHSSSKPLAVRYSMKRAVSDLGPNGFPFEKFVAEIFKAQGYEAVTDQVVYGGCVEHEMDVVAWKENELVMIEAKFHNEPGLKSDLKVALYVKARFDDLVDQEFDYGGKKRKLTSWHLITNTKFTDHAIRYAKCKGLSLIGWNYPEQSGGLEDLITKAGLHPLTCLTTLTQAEKQELLSAGLVLCRQIKENEDRLEQFGLSKKRIPAILEEISIVCS
jgi:hypothetical protein